MTHLGTTNAQLMVPPHIARALLVPNRVCEQNTSITHLDRVIFQHCYISNPEITPTNRLIVALSNFTAAATDIPNTNVHTQVTELKQLLDATQEQTLSKKRVYFNLPTSESAIPVPASTETTTTEQAINRNTQQEPRVVTAAIDKPAGPFISNCALKDTSLSNRMLCRCIVQKAVAKQTLRRALRQSRAPAQYVTDVINEVFDPDTGKSLKY
jgi:hypothetical protein